MTTTHKFTPLNVAPAYRQWFAQLKRAAGKHGVVRQLGIAFIVQNLPALVRPPDFDLFERNNTGAHVMLSASEGFAEGQGEVKIVGAGLKIDIRAGRSGEERAHRDDRLQEQGATAEDDHKTKEEPAQHFSFSL